MKKRLTFSIVIFTLLFGFALTTANADDEDIPSPTSVPIENK